MVTTRELVKQALVPVREFLNTAEPIVPEDWEDNPKARYYGDSSDTDKCARLRFDYELNMVGDTSVDDKESISRLMVAAMEGDLIDIVENGDRSSNDPMLKSLDGSNKTGKNLELVCIEQLVVYREHKPKKGSYEYTLFMLLTVEWENDKQG